VGGLTLRTLQLPTTFPTLDEVLGPDDPDGAGFADRVRREVHGRTSCVLTMHAEMEGRHFQAVADRLLGWFREDGVTCLPLEILAERVWMQRGETIPIADVVPRPIRGRAGTVAMPAGFEVPYGPLTTDY
jgi:hypothetical protein